VDNSGPPLEVGVPKVFANKQLMALPTHDEI
jgi:hypothetical protein